MNPPGFFDGMRYPLLGLKHLLEHRELWPYAAKSLVVGLLLFMLLVAIAAGLVLGVFTQPLELKTLLLGCAAALLGVVGGIVLFALIGNVIAGPYLESMTERMMADAGRIKETPRGYWAAFGAGLVDQLGRFALFLAVQAMLLGVWLTPAALFHPLAASVVTAFFVAIEHLEYPLEARGLRFFARIDWGLKRLRPSLGFGTTLFFVMPVAGFVFLPAAVCGAVLLEAELERSTPTLGVPSS